MSRSLSLPCCAALLAALLLPPGPSWAFVCIQGPLPGNPPNPDNRLRLCSPEPSQLSQVVPGGYELQARILPGGGVELAWDAPPRQGTSYVGLTQATWIFAAATPTVAEKDTVYPVSGVEVSGTYLGFRDRRIQLAVDRIGAQLDSGVVGQDEIRFTWLSVYGASDPKFERLLTTNASTAGRPLPFLQVHTTTGVQDTTLLPGLRVTFQRGLKVYKDRATAFRLGSLGQGIPGTAFFDVEDFEGFHVWRWRADPVTPSFEAMGEYSKEVDDFERSRGNLGAGAVPRAAWRDPKPWARRFTFLDRNVFDGFVYHYAVTSFDQGFKRQTSGSNLAAKFESQGRDSLRATCLEVDAKSGKCLSYRLSPTQLQVDYRMRPPTSFRPIAAVPNPYRESNRDGNLETERIFFINAPPSGTLYIFTLGGDLVLQRDHDMPSVGTIAWDTKNASSEPVSSGVYIYKIVDRVSGEQSYGRLAIIR